MTKTKYITVVVIALLIILDAWSLVKAAPIITTGMEVVGTQRIGIANLINLIKVLDHDNGVTCYVIGSGISCLSPIPTLQTTKK